MKKLSRFVKVATFALLLGAIREEMNKPEDQRAWNGLVAGVVPYDFRPPTFERLKAALWSPEDERLITPHPWGVGWTINLGRLLRVGQALKSGVSS